MPEHVPTPHVDAPHATIPESKQTGPGLECSCRGLGLAVVVKLSLLGGKSCFWARSLAVGALPRISDKGAFGPFDS